MTNQSDSCPIPGVLSLTGRMIFSINLGIVIVVTHVRCSSNRCVLRKWVIRQGGSSFSQGTIPSQESQFSYGVCCHRGKLQVKGKSPRRLRLHGNPKRHVWTATSRDSCKQTTKRAVGSTWILRTTPHARPMETCQLPHLVQLMCG